MSMISISVAKSPASAFWKTRADLRSCWSISPGYSDAAVSHSKVSRKHVFHLYPIHITSISYSYHINILFISCNKPIFFTPPRLEGHWRGGKPSISAESGDHPDLWWSMDSVATSRHERLRLHPTLRRRLGGYGARQHARPGEGSPPALHHGPGLCWVAEVSIPVCDEHRGKSGDSVAI